MCILYLRLAIVSEKLTCKVKPTYSNDRNAPRMRKGEFSKMVITRALWSKFKKSNPKYKSLTWKEFYSVWMEIAAKIRHETIYNPLGVKLGFHCGELKLQYLPYKFEVIDHSTSEKIGEQVTYTNLTNKGKVAKIKWERRQAVKTNKILQFYAFDPTREMNKMADKYIQNHPDKLRVARVTLGGHSVWRQKIKK